MKRIIKTALILGSASLLFSCMKESSEPILDFAEREDIILTRSQSDFVNNNQEFAFELFKEVSESKGFNESFIISPLSVTIALGMVTNGAEGETRKEINETLRYKDESIIINKLGNIGSKLSDFEEIEKNGKQYSLLGKGNFGYVEKMKSKINNKIYAIKKIDKNNPNFEQKNFDRETEIMLNLNHENIVEFYGFFEDKEKIIISCCIIIYLIL